MASHLRILAPGAFSAIFAANLFALRADLLFALLLIGTLFLLMLLQHRWYRQARDRQARQHALGKRVSEFAECLALSPPESVDDKIIEGLRPIVELVAADRICWYEMEEESAALLHRYTASISSAPLSLERIPAQKMPFLAERIARNEVVALRHVQDLPPEAHVDAQLLRQLGLKSLLLIPSNCSPRRRGVLGLAYYSSHQSWAEESIHQLAIAANIIGAALERKYAQTASQQSEERFRYLFAQASIGIALETMDGRILDVNPAFCSMLGYSPEQLMSSSCAQISHPEDEEVEKLLFEELRQGLRPSYRLEKRFFRNDGSQMWGQGSVSLLNRNHGSPPLVIGMVSDVSAQKTAEACLYQRDQELQRLAGHLIEAQEEERRRISRDLHDDIGQRIALLACEIDFERRSKTASRNDRKPSVLPKLRKELDAIATDIHKLSHELHSASLQCCGLKVALKDLCWKYSHNHHLDVELHTERLDPKLPPDIALCLFRVVQEALANALKHGHTKKVLVTVVQDSRKVRLSVRDFGVGFDPSVHPVGIGLMSMRERVRFCGGMLTVRSAPNEGTEIAAEVVAVKTMAATVGT